MTSVSDASHTSELIQPSDSSAIVLSADDALKLAGDQNKYQIRMFIFFALQWAILALTLMGQPFLFKNPEFQCSLKSNPSVSFPCAASRENCANSSLNITPNSDSPETLVKSFNLYCDRTVYISVVQACFFVTGAIGIVVFSYLADTIGRFIILFGSFSLTAVMMFSASFAEAYGLFGALLAVCGVGINVFVTLCFISIAESSSNNELLVPNISNIMVLMFWAIGEMLAAPLAYAANSDWRLLCRYCVGLPLLVMIAFFFWIYESPKFLVIKKDYASAKKVLKKIAAANNKELPDFDFKEAIGSSPSTSSNNEARNSKYGYLDLFRYKSTRYSTIGGSIMFFTINFVYYGTTLALTGFPGSIYVNVLVASGAELLAYIATVPVATKLKRKVTFTSCFLISGVFAFSFFFISIPDECNTPDGDCYQKTLQTIFVALTKFGISIPFCLIYLYLNELFPTVVRSLGNGFCQTMARIGSVLSPVVTGLMSYTSLSPMIPLGIFSLVGALSVLPMRETFGEPLSDELKEKTTTKASEKVTDQSSSVQEDELKL